ncbi:MAG TPA: DUF1329 domain-containing protein [Gammaproteobacteria bacterium]|nr:DUF1329 domain-containing protein [Gammaproteobacteria bacterium]
MNTYKKLVLIAAMAASFMTHAAVSEQEAQRLQSDLTPLGGERAGNADGTIPAWQGGLKAAPDNVQYRGAGSHHPNPYADDTPVLTITADTVDRYADKLTPGQLAMFKKYPDTFKMQVFQTRRTQAVPARVEKNTLRNAVTANLADGGNGVDRAFGGIPFPIPGNGQEVIWNHLLRWQGEARLRESDSFAVHSNGDIAYGEDASVEVFPYYSSASDEETFDGNYYMVITKTLQPTRKKGELVLVQDPINQVITPRKAWQYIPGARRVRRAPTVAYDTPAPFSSGLSTYDDIFMFNGAIDKYEWKLIGKEEKYIPYNNYEMDNPAHDYKSILTKGHMNQDLVRYELHRVCKVEATLKGGQRHLYSKRVMYFDEDSWVMALSDSYDAHGELWRTNVGYSKNAFELPGVVLRGFVTYDLNSGGYAVLDLMNQQAELPRYNTIKKANYFTPSNLRKISRR